MDARTAHPVGLVVHAMPSDSLSLEELGVAEMTPEDLADLAERLYRIAGWVAEYRYLKLERRHRLLEGIPNRPTIGYYLQSWRKTA